MRPDRGDRVSRPELAPLIPNDPRMDGLPKGTCEFSYRDGQLWVDHADPRIVISAELIDTVARSELWPDATLGRLDFTIPNGHAGALLKIRGANRTVVYRLTAYADWCLGYIAEWPD
jgi:hypothetical protein